MILCYYLRTIDDKKMFYSNAKHLKDLKNIGFIILII